MGRKNEPQKFIVTARNSSGSMTMYPDGRVEGSVTISAKRHAMAVEGMNQLRQETVRRGA